MIPVGRASPAAADATDDRIGSTDGWTGPTDALVVLNVAGETTRFEPPQEPAGADASLLACNYDASVDRVTAVDLRPREARVYGLDPATGDRRASDR